jgi:hypothetical protein
MPTNKSEATRHDYMQTTRITTPPREGEPHEQDGQRQAAGEQAERPPATANDILIKLARVDLLLAQTAELLQAR